jgi:hypothetical protein
MRLVPNPGTPFYPHIIFPKFHDILARQNLVGKTTRFLHTPGHFSTAVVNEKRAPAEVCYRCRFSPVVSEPNPKSSVDCLADMLINREGFQQCGKACVARCSLSMGSALVRLAKDSLRGSCGDGTVALAKIAYAVDGLTLRQALHLGLGPRARLTCLAY